MQETRRLARQLVRLPDLKELTVQICHHFLTPNGQWNIENISDSYTFSFLDVFLEGISSIKSLNTLELEDPAASVTLARWSYFSMVLLLNSCLRGFCSWHYACTLSALYLELWTQVIRKAPNMPRRAGKPFALSKPVAVLSEIASLRPVPEIRIHSALWSCFS